MSVEELVDSALETGEIITIIYNGGSKKGAMRDIGPISSKNGKVRARCYELNTVKTFMLDKMELVNEASVGETKRWAEAEVTDQQKYSSIEQIFTEHHDEFRNIGWYVFFENNCFSLHRKQKRADKPLKAPSICLTYDEYTSDSVYEFDGVITELNVRKSAKPYHLNAQGHYNATFSNLTRCVEKLIALSKELPVV